VKNIIQIFDYLDIYGDYSNRIIVTTVISSIISFAIYLIPSIFLFLFSKKTKIALDTQKSSDFDMAFKKLNVFYKSLGIMVIVFISLIIILIAFFTFR
jgi:preprotein translocase subunit SecY